MKAKSGSKAVHRSIVPFAEFSARVNAVARGEEAPPEWAGKVVYATEGARQHWTQQKLPERSQMAGIAKLLADNHDLLGTLQSRHPQSVGALARLVKRSESNVSRSLGKLERLGIVKMCAGEGRSKQPILAIDRLIIELNVVSGEVVINRRDAAGASASTADHPKRRPTKASASV